MPQGWGSSLIQTIFAPFPPFSLALLLLENTAPFPLSPFPSLHPNPDPSSALTERFQQAAAPSGNTPEAGFPQGNGSICAVSAADSFPGAGQSCWWAAGSLQETSLAPGCRAATHPDISSIILIILGSVAHSLPAELLLSSTTTPCLTGAWLYYCYIPHGCLNFPPLPSGELRANKDTRGTFCNHHCRFYPRPESSSLHLPSITCTSSAGFSEVSLPGCSSPTSTSPLGACPWFHQCSKLEEALDASGVFFMGKQTLLPPCHWLSSSPGSVKTESHCQLMNACQGIRHWSQSSYEETDVHIPAAPVTATACQQPPPRGGGFLAVNQNPSTHRWISGSIFFAALGLQQSQASSWFPSSQCWGPTAQHEQDTPHHQFQAGAGGVRRSPA